MLGEVYRRNFFFPRKERRNKLPEQRRVGGSLSSFAPRASVLRHDYRKWLIVKGSVEKRATRSRDRYRLGVGRTAGFAEKLAGARLGGKVVSER